ncbi:hypothetical protein Cgig2_033208 [Carnegiea gigantea]|uniref:Uncharacterized protein n=1 Tax=Carnegiea gigantea TaxID=171969 RepID=A0A9Q1K275_9CARY|nr:hypothetical protein Cgig2_033208 [Carnegiea gigantea]
MTTQFRIPEYSRISLPGREHQHYHHFHALSRETGNRTGAGATGINGYYAYHVGRHRVHDLTSSTTAANPVVSITLTSSSSPTMGSPTCLVPDWLETPVLATNRFHLHDSWSGNVRYDKGCHVLKLEISNEEEFQQAVDQQDYLSQSRVYHPKRGVHIIVSRLGKVECRHLVDKITTRIKTWSTRQVSYAARATLFHSNKACLAKLIWEVALKKDVSCIRWVHGKYLINKNGWNYTTIHDVHWCWTKSCTVKEEFKEGCDLGRNWYFKDNWHSTYSVRSGYEWCLSLQNKKLS